MVRSRRTRRSHRDRQRAQSDEGLARLIDGWRRTERRDGHDWNVQQISSARAVKAYVCPGCARQIEPGMAHIVAWRADGVLGDQADLSHRRHWHSHCWRIA